MKWPNTFEFRHLVCINCYAMSFVQSALSNVSSCVTMLVAQYLYSNGAIVPTYAYAAQAQLLATPQMPT